MSSFLWIALISIVAPLNVDAGAHRNNDKTAFLYNAESGSVATPAPKEMHVLAKFIRIMMKFSSIHGALDGQIQDFEICLSQYSDEKYRLSDLHGTVVNQHRISVALFEKPEQITDSCHLAFLSSHETEIVDYRQLSKNGVLTMSDAYEFARKGGVLEVLFLKDKVAFFVRFSRIKKTALEPNSKFLRLATDVY